VLGVDLGADRILVWRLDPATGRLQPNDPPGVSLPPGSGPRHLAFHPAGRLVFVLNELAGSITTFRYDGARGALSPLQTVSTLPAGYAGSRSTAEIRVHPGGRFLYATNRGHGSVAMFAIDAATGDLRSLGWVSTQGDWPRGMNLDPSGTFLYAANQNSDSVAVFRVEPGTGMLTPTGEVVRTPTPVDVEFGGTL
jgi:6-phosphogluconolactonase